MLKELGWVANLAKVLPLVRARIVVFQFFTTSPLKMQACGTGREFAEYDQRVGRNRIFFGNFFV
jgi:hypothetical protein